MCFREKITIYASTGIPLPEDIKYVQQILTKLKTCAILTPSDTKDISYMGQDIFLLHRLPSTMAIVTMNLFVVLKYIQTQACGEFQTYI